MSGSPRILVVRLTAVGDMIQTEPVVNALRASFPSAFLGWVVEGRGGDLLAGHAALNRLIRVPRHFLQSPAAVLNLRRELRECRFDVTLDVQGLTKSALVAWLAGARRRIGFRRPQAREFSPWFNTEFVAPTRTHLMERYLELLRPLGVENPPVRSHLPEDPASAARMDRWLDGQGFARGTFALINPGAGWPSRIWPTERFAEVARHLGHAHRLPVVVVWAGDQEKAQAARIVSHSGQHARMAPGTSLTELAALCRRARLCVSGDTGPLHLAGAVGTPCVGLYGTTWHEQTQPYGPQHMALQVRKPAGTHRALRTATNEAIAAITIAQVQAACDQLLTRRAPHAA